MIRGLYCAASALAAATVNQELVSENLANATVPGYRRGGMAFESLLPSAGSAGPNDRLRSVQTPQVFTDFEAGPLEHTNNPLDVAASGNVFFVLDGPNGPLYTRNGSFQRTAQGELQSVSGLPVRSGGGRITIPTDATRITISKDGVVRADNSEVGRLQLAEFTDPSVLRRAGTTLFEGPQAATPAPGTFNVEQGYREGSNVKVVNEMVNMIAGMRFYEAAERAMRAIGDAVGMNTKPQ